VVILVIDFSIHAVRYDVLMDIHACYGIKKNVCVKSVYWLHVLLWIMLDDDGHLVGKVLLLSNTLDQSSVLISGERIPHHPCPDG